MTPFNDLTARKIRNALERTPGVSERQIIGGVAFLVSRSYPAVGLFFLKCRVSHQRMFSLSTG